MENPYEFDESPLDDETTFPCACGDERCRGHYNDPANILLKGAWYAADCDMGQRQYRIANGQPSEMDQWRR